MKYSITIYRHESKDIEVVAEDPAAALKLAQESNPGFGCDEATELLGKDDFGDETPGKTFSLMGQCESCNRFLFDEDAFSETLDGCDICEACCKELSKE